MRDCVSRMFRVFFIINNVEDARNMDIENVSKIISEIPNLATAIGMRFISTPEDDTCMATMTVDERTCQPMGLLSGGASLALAEYLAGVGSTALCPDRLCVGMNVSGSHVRSAYAGDTVTALARIVHKGRTLHVWNVCIKDSSGGVLSTVSVTNFVTDKKVEEK